MEETMMQRPVPLFDAHCHLQDRRIAHALPQLLDAASHAGVKWFAVNGTSEEDWEAVKKLGEEHKEIIPCFGLHPWYVETCSSNWLERLRAMLDAVPSAALGEAGLDKGTRGRAIDFSAQVDVLKQQLLLAKEFDRPVSVHCVRAFGELHEILKETGPFPAGVILHSYLGSAEMVQPFAKQGSYFSFSGFLTSLSTRKAQKMLQEVPLDRLLLETDAPDALPQTNSSSLMWVPGDTEAPQSRTEESHEPDHSAKEKEVPPQDKQRPKFSHALNHPANIKSVLDYVASMLGMPEEDVAHSAYNNARQLFSYQGSKVMD